MARARLIAAGTTLLVLAAVPLAGAKPNDRVSANAATVAAGDPIRAEVRNGTTGKETEIIGKFNAATGTKGGYVTRQSNTQTGSKAGGGAIYGCRGGAGGTTDGAGPRRGGRHDVGVGALPARVEPRRGLRVRVRRRRRRGRADLGRRRQDGQLEGEAVHYERDRRGDRLERRPGGRQERLGHRGRRLGRRSPRRGRRAPDSRDQPPRRHTDRKQDGYRPVHRHLPRV